MAITQVGPATRSVDRTGDLDRGRAVTPIRWWGATGALLVAIQVYAYGRWILSGPTRTPTGPDKVPTGMAIAAHAQEILSPALFAVCVYWFLIRPWRRERRITLAGLMVPACMSLYWQDLLANYVNHTFTYNAALINFGSWFNFVPGWASPRGAHLVEPVIFSLPGYVVFILPPCLFVAHLMRKAKARWPHVGVLGLWGVAFAIGAPIVALLETIWLRSGVYVYAGTIPSLTVFRDHYYQYPLYEFFGNGFMTAAWASILYFRDDKGHTVAERGVDRLRCTARQKVGVRLLALIAIVNVPFLIYNVGMVGISMMPSFRWGTDTVSRSYLRDNVCGPGTTYHCPGKGIPIPRRGDAHVDPDGRLVTN